MTAARDPFDTQASADRSEREQVLDNFEAAWQAGKQPTPLSQQGQENHC